MRGTPLPKNARYAGHLLPSLSEYLDIFSGCFGVGVSISHEAHKENTKDTKELLDRVYGSRGYIYIIFFNIIDHSL
jgi:hypothetical protein